MCISLFCLRFSINSWTFFFLRVEIYVRSPRNRTPITFHKCIARMYICWYFGLFSQMKVYIAHKLPINNINLKYLTNKKKELVVIIIVYKREREINVDTFYPIRIMKQETENDKWIDNIKIESAKIIVCVYSVLLLSGRFGRTYCLNTYKNHSNETYQK